MKVSKPTKKPPVTAVGKVKIDDKLEDPRNYLKNSSSSYKEGYRVLSKDMDIHDFERNPKAGQDRDADYLDDISAAGQVDRSAKGE